MQNTNTIRASISFPPGLYQNLEEIAKRKKVSLAWVVRDASERYVAEEADKRSQAVKRPAKRAGKPARGT